MSKMVFLSIKCEYYLIVFFCESLDSVNINILCKLYRNTETEAVKIKSNKNVLHNFFSIEIDLSAIMASNFC